VQIRKLNDLVLTLALAELLVSCEMLIMKRIIHFIENQVKIKTICFVEIIKYSAR